jgi:hypothetical protein
MNIPYPTFKEFRQFNDNWRKSQKREPQHKFLVATYYPFAILGITFLFILLAMLIGSVESSKRSYRYSGKYKKVIKEGVLFDTVEYHER